MKNLIEPREKIPKALFPKPDRSNFRPKLKMNEETGEMDIGWVEGEFSGGRPYRAELWSWTHLSAITFFFSSVGLENVSAQEIASFLEKELPLHFKGNKKVGAKIVEDPSGNLIWSVSIVTYQNGEALVQHDISFNAYEGNEKSQKRKKRSALLFFRLSSLHL